MVKYTEPEEDENKAFIFQVEEGEVEEKIQYPTCDICLDGERLQVYADSCSPFTLIEKRLFDEKFAKHKIKLESADICPSGYNKETIPLVGMVRMRISFKDRHTVGKVYVTKQGSNLLGWKHQKELGITLDPNNVDQVLLVEQPVLSGNLSRDFPEVFTEELGQLKNYMHKIVLKEGAIPVIHKTRSVPLLMREPLKLELQQLVNQGVIQEIENSEWLAPIVLSTKDNGKNIRLCVDLRDLNANIMVDRHP